MKALCILLFTCSFMVLGYTPAFENEVQLYCGGTPIDCTYYGSPASYDWNGDGAKDLMVGQHGGEIRLFLNEGTSSSPVFNSWSYMQADGVNIDVLSSWCGGAMTPQVVDWNDDGIDDLIVGDSSGFINYFMGTAPQTLTEEPMIQASGVNIDVGNYSSPVVIDWNEDGLDDLVIGSASPGDIRLYLNSGTLGVPVFTTFTYLASGGSKIIQPGCCSEVFDLNCDGKKDLVLGVSISGNGRLYYYENVGTNSAPEFEGFVHLQAGGAPSSLYQYTRIETVDWNDDGFPDILASEYYAYVYLFLAIPPVSIGDTCEPVSSGIAFGVAGSPTTGLFSITLELAEPVQTEIDIYSMNGQRLERVVDGEMSAGTHAFGADLSSSPAGVYIVRCATGQNVYTEKVVLVR